MTTIIYQHTSGETWPSNPSLCQNLKKKDAYYNEVSKEGLGKVIKLNTLPKGARKLSSLPHNRPLDHHKHNSASSN
ncbi:hypothetical protein TorRG33x02_119450, partial [Trema orientale]